MAARNDRRAHRHARHVLDAGRDHDVVRAGDHTLRGEVRGLLRRTALAVDRGADRRLGETGGERGVAADVEALVADLHHAAHDHVFDEGGIDVVAVDERLQHVGGEVDGVDVLQLAVAASERGTDCVDDDGSGHGGLQKR